MQPTDRKDQIVTRAHPYRVLLVVSVATFVASLDLFIVNIAFPDIQRDFAGTSDASLSWVLNAYAIVFAALLVPAGRLADLYGRKRGFLGGLLVFLLGSALCAAAPSVAWLIAARVLQAAGAAALMPTSLALLLPEFPPNRRAMAVGLWSATGAVAAAAGPPIGGLLVQASWHWVFLVNLPVGIVTAFAAVRVLREARDPAGGAIPDLAGAALLVSGIGALTLAIVKGPAWGWGGAAVVGLFAGSALALAAFVARSARHRVPVVELDMLRVRSFAAANIAALLFFAAFGAMLLSGVLFLTRVWHEDVLTAGLMLAPGPAMATVFAVPAGALATRFGQRAVALPGALIYAFAGIWWLSHVGAQPSYAADYLPGMMIGGAGVGLVIPSLASAATASLPPARFATGSAIFGMARQIGAALGVAVLVALIGSSAAVSDPVEPFRHGWQFMVGGALAVAVATLAIGRLQAPAAVPAAAEAPA